MIQNSLHQNKNRDGIRDQVREGEGLAEICILLRCVLVNDVQPQPPRVWSIKIEGSGKYLISLFFFLFRSMQRLSISSQVSIKKIHTCMHNPKRTTISLVLRRRLFNPMFSKFDFRSMQWLGLVTLENWTFLDLDKFRIIFFNY